MAFNYSPKIVTDGLVLYLDAANTKSIVSGSTTWTDLSRNGNNGTLTPGVSGLTFSRDGGGSLVFDGTDDYVATNYTLPSNTSFTITAWAKSSTASVQNRVFGNADSVSGTSGVDIIWGYVGSTQIYCVRRNGANNGTLDTQSTAITNLLTGWHQVVYTYSTTAGSLIYVDGTQVGSNTNTGFSSALTFRVGRDGNGTDKFNGQVSQVQIYNRALSAQEVLQNYNATKSRFGLK
jgi:hypothetical protein